MTGASESLSLFNRAAGHFSELEPNIQMAFGLLLLAGVLGGVVANRLRWLPTITAFMLIGQVIGPHGFNIITYQMLSGSKILIEIALGLILYKLGNMLHPLVIVKSRRIVIPSLVESLLTFVVVTAAGYVMGLNVMVAMIIGTIAISSSPAVLVHASEELRTAGPVTDRAKSLVAMNNLISFVAFSLVVPFALSTHGADLVPMVALSFYKLATAVVLGGGLGWLAVQIAKFLRPQDEHYRFVIVSGTIMLMLGIANMIGSSSLFAALTLGMATRWFERQSFKLSHVGMGEGGDLFFIILFVMAGAKIDLLALLALGAVPFVLALARGGGKFAAIYGLRSFSKHSKVEAASLSILLVPMAGMAIGLTTVLYSLDPSVAVSVATVVLAMVAIFETIGPFFALKAFRMSGEVGAADALEKPVQSPGSTGQ